MLKPKLRPNKECILNRISQEALMERFTGVQLTPKAFKSPFRKDNKPSCCYFYGDNGILYFKDFGSYDYGDCFWAASKYFGTSKNLFYNIEMLLDGEEVKASHWLSKRKDKLKVRTSNSLMFINPTIKTFDERDIGYWGKWGISRTVLGLYKTYSCKHVTISTDGWAYALTPDNNSPLYVYNVQGLFKTYKPFDKDNKWKNNYSMSDSPVIEGFEQLQDTDTVFIQKAQKENMFIRQHLNLDSIAAASETTFVGEDIIRRFIDSGKKIILMLDNDEAGKASSQIYLDKYGNNIRNLPSPKHKNITDWYESDSEECLRWLFNSI